MVKNVVDLSKCFSFVYELELSDQCNTSSVLHQSSASPPLPPQQACMNSTNQMTLPPILLRLSPRGAFINSETITKHVQL